MDAGDRTNLFWKGCIPLRIGLVVAALHVPVVIATLLAAMGAGMMYLYASNTRQEAREGGGNTWWNDLRPYHGSLLLLGGVLAFQEHPYAYVPVALDVAFGIYAWLNIRDTKKI